jgi:nicotinamidase-related amidase
MAAVRRIAVDQCCGAIIDYQEFFVEGLPSRRRAHLAANTKNFVRLLGYFRIPILATLERPVDGKGSLPDDIRAHLGARSAILEKDFFDLTREKTIRDHLGRLKRKQVIVAGCETDVCVLQSCLGLVGLGYEVFAVEELLFSSSRDTDAAVARLKAAGVVFVTYKTLFYELIEAVEGGRHGERMFAKYGPFPRGLPDDAVR